MAEPSEIVGGFVDGAEEIAGDPAGSVARVFGIGTASGNDGGSSNWAAWGHEQIRSMLDSTVDPADIGEGARVWRDLRDRATDIIHTLTRDLAATVSEGWRGASADAAMSSLHPVDQWAERLAAAADDTSSLLDDSGYYAGETKATVPPPEPHDWTRSLGSFALGGGAGAFVDAVAQEQKKEEARAEAVRIMTRMYSAPINQNRAVVPVYPQLTDPTLRPPEPSPVAGPSPGAGHPGPGVSGGAVDGHVPRHPPAAAISQSVGPGHPAGAAAGGDQFGGAPRGGGVAAGVAGAAAGLAGGALPGTGRGGDGDRSARGVRAAGWGAGTGANPGGALGRGLGAGPGSAGGLGPRGSAVGTTGTAGAADGRMSAAPGAGAGSAARGVVGGVPMAGAGTGRGPGGDDTERRRPSYLVETDDIFGDGRRVAPPVIGEDPAERRA